MKLGGHLILDSVKNWGLIFMSTPSGPSVTVDPNNPTAKDSDKVPVDTLQTRIAILTLAHNPADTPDVVVARAKKYFNWLTKPDNGTTPPPPVTP